MSRTHHLPILPLILIAAVPFAWIACGGGETKPPESAASESSAASSTEAPADSDTPSAAGSASAAAAEASSAPAPEPPPAASPPPAPTLGSTDCGKCIEKTCAKPEAACAKNSDCQSALDSINGCSSGAASCIDGATPPTAAKPKKLAAAYQACAKKAVTAKACKAKCQ